MLLPLLADIPSPDRVFGPFWWQWLVGTVVAVAALLTGLNVIWKYVRKALTAIVKAAKLIERLDKEFSPNGGNSMHDLAVKSVDQNKEIIKRLCTVEDSCKELKDGQVELFRRSDDAKHAIELTRFLNARKLHHEVAGDTQASQLLKEEEAWLQSLGPETRARYSAEILSASKMDGIQQGMR